MWPARKTQRLWGHAPVSASDEGRVHSPHSKFRDSATELSLKAPSRRARRAWLGGAIAFGAALPLLAGALQSYGEDADAAIDLCSRRPPTSPSLKPARTGLAAAPPRAARPTPPTPSRSPPATWISSASSTSRSATRIFRKNWVSAPSSTDASDGLGPLFNSRACQNCHLKDGRGHPPLSADVPDDSGSMLVRLSVPPPPTRRRRCSPRTA